MLVRPSFRPRGGLAHYRVLKINPYDCAGRVVVRHRRGQPPRVLKHPARRAGEQLSSRSPRGPQGAQRALSAHSIPEAARPEGAHQAKVRA